MPSGPAISQRPRAARELGVEQEERQAGEMIAVEMRDQDDVDVLARNAEALQRDQRRRAAVDQEIGALARDVKAGVEAPAGAQRIAAADELQLHVSASASS